MDKSLSIYITKDGDYGDASARDEVEWKTIVPTFFFTDEMWEAFDACEPSERADLHWHFSIGQLVHNIEDDYLDQCSYCGLTWTELGYKLETENDNA